MIIGLGDELRVYFSWVSVLVFVFCFLSEFSEVVKAVYFVVEFFFFDMIGVTTENSSKSVFLVLTTDSQVSV